MSSYENKTAIITGGAEGIGLAVARSYGERGMNIVVADIDEAQMALGVKELTDLGIKAIGLPLDVVEPSQWQDVVTKTQSEFGDIHFLLNNAGVSGIPGPIEKTKHNDWRWVLDVNLMGVVYGAEAVVPAIKQHGQGGWMVNVASMAGMSGVPYANAYTATKVAVVGMSESWRAELKKDNILVSVLCPAFVKTRIHLSYRNRQEQYRGAPKSERPASAKPSSPAKNPGAEFVENGIDPRIVGERVVEAVEAREMYIFTHPMNRELVQKRSKAIDDAFARAQASPLLADVKDEAPISFDIG